MIIFRIGSELDHDYDWIRDSISVILGLALGFRLCFTVVVTVRRRVKDIPCPFPVNDMSPLTRYSYLQMGSAVPQRHCMTHLLGRKKSGAGRYASN